MEFLRFGSSIPGSYWGCCAADIIQDFNQDPDRAASIQLVSGDGGGPLMSGQEDLFAGPTYRDIFLQRLRSGTFEKRDMPNHAFIAILTENQVNSSIGGKWMALLKETGFEFIRTVANSVYTGTSLGAFSKGRGSSLNHIFMLVRNIGQSGCGDPFTPPKAWSNLPSVKPEAWDTDRNGLAKAQHAADTKIWNDLGAPKFLKRSELPKDTPVILAGQRIEWAKQQPAEVRAAAKINSGLFPNELPAGIKPKSPFAVSGNDDPFVVFK